MTNRASLAGPMAVALLAAAALALPAAHAAGPARCRASGLVIWAGEEPGGGTAGSVYYRIEFTNLTASACTVSGHPKVNAVDLEGRRIGAVAIHEKGKRARPVTLAPGHGASATLRIVDALNYPTGKCGATTAAGLRVSVPGGPGAKIAPLAFEACARAVAKTLAVAPVTAG